MISAATVAHQDQMITGDRAAADGVRSLASLDGADRDLRLRAARLA